LQFKKDDSAQGVAQEEQEEHCALQFKKDDSAQGVAQEEQ
jgi:hypothetical protein